MDDFFLLVGLGNPGSEYETTRHNLGFMIIDNISRMLNSSYKHEDDLYLIAQTRFKEKNVILAKPLTFMNKSGMAVSILIEKFQVPLRQLLIILDDFNLPFGKIRIRSKGSDGGHNGLASIIDAISSEAFPRLRVGIGKENIEDPVSFVLSKFDEDEMDDLPELIQRSSEAGLNFLEEGIEQTMCKYN